MIYKQCNISEVTTYDDCTEQAYKDQLDQGVGAVGIRNFGGHFAGVIEIFFTIFVKKICQILPGK